jgi:cysteine-rich repeat protein
MSMGLSVRIRLWGPVFLALALAPACSPESAPAGAGGSTSTSGSGGNGGAGASSSSGATTTTITTTTTTTTETATTTDTTGAGGTGPADPCETPPAGTVDAPAEGEPNDTLATANGLPPGKKGFIGSLCPAGDVDFYGVVLLGGESLSVAVNDGNGGCPASALPFVSILDAAGNAIASDTGFGCVTLAPKASPALAGLPAGAYYVRIASSEPLPVGSYAIDISVRAPGCGDDIVQLGEGEQCDDGNESGGDGCSGACQLEGDFVDEVESNGTQATATPLSGAQGGVGALSPEGDLDFYSFAIATPGSAVSAVVSDGLGGCPYGFVGSITLFGPNGTVLAGSDGGGLDGCPFLDPVIATGATGLPAGSYAIKVVTVLPSVQPLYVLGVSVQPPGCGDAVQVAGEQCDDGNSASGDGCSSACVVEPPWEIEPNDTQAKATPLWPGTSRWRARLTPAGERDWYSFTVAQGANVTLSTNAPGNAGACDFDTLLHLVNAQGVQLKSNDNAGVNACSKLAPATDPEVANMAAGTYFVWVEDISEIPLTPSYELRIDLQ